MRSDIVVRSPSGRAILAVEVKARHGVRASWAAQYRRNLLAHGVGDTPAYFMIVTADDAYLWRESTLPEHGTRLPDAEAPLADIVGADQLVGELDGRALELIVQSWLSAASAVETLGHLSAAARALLVDSGLLDALHGAAVEFQPA